MVKFDVKRSLESGETVNRRDTSFDEMIGLLFPALEGSLSGPFGTDLMSEGDGETDDC